jgi:hypothetical protein
MEKSYQHFLKDNHAIGSWEHAPPPSALGMAKMVNFYETCIEWKSISGI